jgi:hypothetical protein
MRRATVVALGVAVGGLILLVAWAYPAIQLDRCLDRGGRWDYAERACGGPR